MCSLNKLHIPHYFCSNQKIYTLLQRQKDAICLIKSPFIWKLLDLFNELTPKY